MTDELKNNFINAMQETESHEHFKNAMVLTSKKTYLFEIAL